MAWALDLDGVMWLGDEPIAGSAEAVAQLRAAGEQVAFVTNNSSNLVADVEAQLAAHGVDGRGAVITSAMAAAALVEPGERVFVCGGPGVVEALEQRGAEVVGPKSASVDAVVVGFTRDFDFELLTAATVAVRGGARLIGTNDDPTYPTPAGQIPGGGALLAAVATASETEPVVAGKPYRPMVAVVRERLGETGVMVGDRISTDGRFAANLGFRFALVESGVTASGDVPGMPTGSLVARDLAHAVQLLGVGPTTV